MNLHFPRSSRGHETLTFLRKEISVRQCPNLNPVRNLNLSGEEIRIKTKIKIRTLPKFSLSACFAALRAYENDVLYSYSIPAFSDKGFRYYFTFNYDVSKKVAFWLRLAQTIYRNRNTVGSGLDEIQGNKKTELKAQIRWVF